MKLCYEGHDLYRAWAKEINKPKHNARHVYQLRDLYDKHLKMCPNCKPLVGSNPNPTSETNQVSKPSTLIESQELSNPYLPNEQ